MVFTEPNLFLDSDGRPRVLCGVSVNSGSARLAELAARIGFETVWVEMEHGPTDFSAAEAVCHAVEASGGVAAVRVPDGQRCHVLRALEIGARIVIVPMVNSVEQAASVVRFGKFPPIGQRGFSSRSRGVDYGLSGVPAFFAEANARTHLFVQIETLEGVKNLEGICALDGISGIFVGPGDLSVDLGCSSLTDERLIRTIADCICRAKVKGKHAGIMVVPGPLLRAAMDAGCDLVFAGSDITDLIGSWQRLLESLRVGGTHL